MFYELVYQSIASEEFILSELNELMIISRKNNKENSITGCLVYHNRTFIQVLEGEKSQVLQLFKKIEKDTRHTQIKKSWHGEIDTRGFNGWSMSLVNLHENGLDSIFSDFLDTGNLEYDIEGILTTSKSILRTMKDNM